MTIYTLLALFKVLPKALDKRKGEARIMFVAVDILVQGAGSDGSSRQG